MLGHRPRPLASHLRNGSGRRRPQAAGLRLLHKADAPGQAAYRVVGFGACAPQALSLALRMHAAVRGLNAAADSLTQAGGGVAWRLRVGVARGTIVAGGLGARRRRCHFFGEAAAAAARLAGECPAGETRVQRSLGRAEGAQAFALYPTASAAGGPRGALGLRQR